MPSLLTLDTARRLARDRRDALVASARPGRAPRAPRARRDRIGTARRRLLDWLDRSVPGTPRATPC